jgi:hypothetical protein
VCVALIDNASCTESITLHVLHRKLNFFVRETVRVETRARDLASHERVRLAMSVSRHSVNGRAMSRARVVAWSVRALAPPSPLPTRVRDEHGAAVGLLRAPAVAQLVSSNTSNSSGATMPRRERHASSAAQQSMRDVSVMSYNVWNYDDGAHWRDRVVLLAAVVRAAMPDVVGVQESRLDLVHPNATSQVRCARAIARVTLKSQVEDLQALLRAEYPHFHYEPALELPSARVEEGLGVLSRHAIARTRRYALPPATYDSNRRIALLASVDVDGVFVAFANTHWTFEQGDAQTRQVRDVVM